MDSFGVRTNKKQIMKTEANLNYKDMTISNFLESGLNQNTDFRNPTNELTEEPTLNLELGYNTRLEN